MNKTEKKSRFSLVLKIISAIAIICIVAFFVWKIYLYFKNGGTWAEWTGFGAYVNPSGDFIREKTLWDWLDLLIVPIVLAIGAWLLNRSEKNRETLIEKQRADLEREIESDRQKQSLLESYLDRMTDLLLAHNLGASKEQDEVRSIANARTLAILQNLDPARKSQVLIFLQQANLINKEGTIINLKGLDFSGIVLDTGRYDDWDPVGYGHKLSNANLEQVNFDNAIFIGVDFHGANLAEARIRNAVLENCDFSEAQFYKTSFMGSSLKHSWLVKTKVRGTNFISANLSQVEWEDCELQNAIFDKTIMPDGREVIDYEKWFEKHSRKSKNAA